jgi:hypothetical protein
MSGNLLTIQNGGNPLRNGYLPGKIHNWSWHGERQTALPSGNLHPYGWMLPRTGGGMSIRATGDGSLYADLVPTINGAIDFTGTGTLSAEAALVISMFCDMIGSGSLEANIVGLLNMSVDLEGQGGLEASMSAFANMLIDLQGSGDLEATIAAYGNMSIDIVVTGTGLSTANVGQAVWEALISQFASNPDSAAAKLLSAGSAGDPWSTTLPASYVGSQAGNILAQIQTLVDELHKIQGLDASNPMTVTPSSRVAGAIDLAITGDGVNESIVTRQ